MVTILLLTASNIFMTFAWYGHLKFADLPLWKVIIISWGNSICRILPYGSCQPHRIWTILCRPIKNHSRDHYTCCIQLLLNLLSERRTPLELCSWLYTYCCRRLLYLQKMVVSIMMQDTSETSCICQFAFTDHIPPLAEKQKTFSPFYSKLVTRKISSLITQFRLKLPKIPGL